MGSNCCKGDAAGKPLVRSSSSIYNRSRVGAKLGDRFTSSNDAGGVRLTVSAARTSDSGVYTLQASNAAGKDTTRVRLEVSPEEMATGEDPPNFLRRLQDLTVKVGTRTRFLVEIVSSTECRVTWYRNERRLLEAERIALVRDGNFWCADISAVSVDDAGRWTCTAENVGGRASCSAHLNVLVPKAYKRPEFVEELRALLTEQGTVSLECKVVGVPTPVLRWFKDSREIKAGDVFALTANAEDPTSLGTYTCEAVNCMGRAYSSSKVHVVGRASREGSTRPTLDGVAPEPPPIFTKEVEDHFVRICEPLTMSCNLVVPPWPRSVVWYNKEGKIEASERYHILEDGVGGYLLELPSAEWPDEGEWKCVATSAGGRVGISTCYVSMDVPKNYRKPRFMENLQAVLTEEGLVSFECKVVGFPTPMLSWFKDGQELKPGDVYQLTGTNSLGSYCCIARNCMGQASSSAELTVEDIQNQLNEEEKLQLFSKNQAPKFLQGLKSVEAKIDEPFRFTIKVAIPPEPNVLWYRDDQPVDESSRCRHGKEGRGVSFLDIQNLEFMDQAEWKCVAMNDYGHSITSCFLKLIIPRHYKKPRFLENLQAILSDEGAVNLECKVIGVPQPVLKWYKDGEELKPGDIHKIISGQDGTCCLGTYTCEAQNCMGIAASSASLLGFEDSMKLKNKKKADEQQLQRNLSLSTIHEERTSQMYDTPVGDITLDERGEISFSFDGKEVSVSLYETPDLTEEEALQIVEMYADQLSENVTEHNVVELPPLRFVKETSTSGNLLMEAIIIDVSPEYFTSPEEDLRTEADIEDISIADENGPPQLSLDLDDDGEDYLEKTIALMSEEKSDIPKKLNRKKSDSQKSGDDYFSLSRDQSISDEKKDDDTQPLSESELQSFASARSSGKPKSKSSKPSVDDGQESSEITKTVLLIEDLQKQIIEENNTVPKNNQQRRRSRSSRRSSSGSEKSLNKLKQNVIEVKLETEDIKKEVFINEEKIKSKLTRINSSLTKVINDIQIVERDTILKSELMSTTATASRSLEIINNLLTPISDINSITEAISEMINEPSQIIISMLNRLPEPLENLLKCLTIVGKCIDVESENRTLVKKTSVSIIESCGSDLDFLIKEIQGIHKEFYSAENVEASTLENIITELITNINDLVNIVDKDKNQNGEMGIDVSEAAKEFNHLQNTQKAIHGLKSSLKSLLDIVNQVDFLEPWRFNRVKKIDIILSDMSIPIHDLQTALEHIEGLSIQETKSNLHKYNTEIIDTIMDSILRLRTSFKELSGEDAGKEITDDLNQILIAIKLNIDELFLNINDHEIKIGKFDILNNDNKIEVLQKMAQILITLENNLPILETLPSIKSHMSEFHKNLTKLLENVIESDDREKYFCLLEICEAINRINSSIKCIDSNSELSLANIRTTLKIVKEHINKNMFQQDLNQATSSNITNVLISIDSMYNIPDKMTTDTLHLETVQDLIIKKDTENKVKIILEHIEQTIAAWSTVTPHETAKELIIVETLNKICPILEDLKYNIANSIQEAEKYEKASDLDSLSYTESIAVQLCELHQTVNVLNHIFYENTDDHERSQLIGEYGKPLLELSTALQILQQDIISQCKENESYLNISCAIANVLESLQSCVFVQEQQIIEAADDMSTLEDISGIKSTAEIISSSDVFATATVEETTSKEFIEQFSQFLSSTSLQTLQKLNNHIMSLQNPEFLQVLDLVSNFNDYSIAKSVFTGLKPIDLHIENVYETSEDIPPVITSSLVSEIVQPLEKLEHKLSVIDISNIKSLENISENTKEKLSHLADNVLILKNDLSECLGMIKPTIEFADFMIVVSNKILNLRAKSEKLIYFVDYTMTKSSNTSNDNLMKLKYSLSNFLKSTNYPFEIKIPQIKEDIKNLYNALIIGHDELIKFTAPKLECLAEESTIIDTINDIEDNILTLEEYNFVDVSQNLDSLYATKPEVKTNSIMKVNDDIENTLKDIQTLSQDLLNYQIKFVEDFCETFRNEMSILRALIKKPSNSKRLIKLLQIFFTASNQFKDFQLRRLESSLPENITNCLSIFIVDTEECLKHLQLLLLEEIEKKSHILFDTPVSNINNIEASLPIILQSPDYSHLHVLVNRFLKIVRAIHPCFENIKSSVIKELYLGKIIDSESNSIEIEAYKEYEIFTSFILEELNCIRDDHQKDMYEQILNVIRKHDDYKGAIGSGKILIFIKCISDCSEIFQEILEMIPKPEELRENSGGEGTLEMNIADINNYLENVYTQLQEIQKQHLSCTEKTIVPLEIKSIKQINEFGRYLDKTMDCDTLSLNNTDVSLLIELGNKLQLIRNTLSCLESTSSFENLKALFKPIEEIERKLNKLLSSGNLLDEKNRILKEKRKSLLQHIEQYIEIIEIVEEVSAVIKLDNLKESANIVRELRQSIEVSENVDINEPSIENRIEDQDHLTQKLQKALISLQSQTFDNLQEFAPTINEDMRQQIIEVVTDLQNDLVALTGTNIFVEENLPILLLKREQENILDEDVINSNIVFEEENKPSDKVMDSTESEKHLYDSQNEIENKITIVKDKEPSHLNESQSNLNEIELNKLDSVTVLDASVTKEETGGADMFEEAQNINDNVSLNINSKDEESFTLISDISHEKSVAITDVLMNQLEKYISDDVLSTIQKLSPPLRTEHLKYTIKVAKQLLDCTDSTILDDTSLQTGLSGFSIDQFELALSMYESLSIMFETIFEQSIDLADLIGKDEFDSVKTVVSNLCATLQIIITSVKMSLDVEVSTNIQKQDSDVREQEELKPQSSGVTYNEIILTEIQNLPTSKSITSESIITADPVDNEYTDNLIGIKTLKAQDFAMEKLSEINTEQTLTLDNINITETPGVSCIDENKINMEKVNKDILIDNLDEYISEETLKVFENISPPLNLANINESIQTARQLHEAALLEEVGDLHLSKTQLQLALKLEKIISPICEILCVENTVLNEVSEYEQIKKYQATISNLQDTLKAFITLTQSQVDEQFLDQSEVNDLVTQKPVDYQLIINEEKSDLLPPAQTSTENVHQGDGPSDLLEIENTENLNKYVAKSDEVSQESKSNLDESNNTNILQEDVTTSIIEDLKDTTTVLQPNDEHNWTSLAKLLELFQDASNTIDLSSEILCVDSSEHLQNTLDEVQTVIMELKYECVGSIKDIFNETLEDLECNVRSVLLQINEHSPSIQLKEACVNLQTLAAYLCEMGDTVNIEISKSSNTLCDCTNYAENTIELLETASCIEGGKTMESIISNLNNIKDTMKFLRSSLSDEETLILRGIEVIQSLDSIEDRIFCLEKDIEAEKDIDPITRDGVISAVHSVYGSISNMREAVSNIQKKYMYANYGCPSRNFLLSIKNSMTISNYDNNKYWKDCAKAIRKVLNHFEDIKFYINFDKTARLPSDAAFTKIILTELYTMVSGVNQLHISHLDKDVSKRVQNCLDCVNEHLTALENKTTLEVKDKIPIFKNVSENILDFTHFLKNVIEKEVTRASGGLDDISEMDSHNLVEKPNKDDLNRSVLKDTEIVNDIELNKEIQNEITIVEEQLDLVTDAEKDLSQEENKLKNLSIEKTVLESNEILQETPVLKEEQEITLDIKVDENDRQIEKEISLEKLDKISNLQVTESVDSGDRICHVDNKEIRDTEIIQEKDVNQNTKLIHENISDKEVDETSTHKRESENIKTEPCNIEILEQGPADYSIHKNEVNINNRDLEIMIQKEVDNKLNGQDILENQMVKANSEITENSTQLESSTDKEGESIIIELDQQKSVNLENKIDKEEQNYIKPENKPSELTKPIEKREDEKLEIKEDVIVETEKSIEKLEESTLNVEDQGKDEKLEIKEDSKVETEKSIEKQEESTLNVEDQSKDEKLEIKEDGKVETEKSIEKLEESKLNVEDQSKDEKLEIKEDGKIETEKSIKKQEESTLNVEDQSKNEKLEIKEDGKVETEKSIEKLEESTLNVEDQSKDEKFEIKEDGKVETEKLIEKLEESKLNVEDQTKDEKLEIKEDSKVETEKFIEKQEENKLKLEDQHKDEVIGMEDDSKKGISKSVEKEDESRVKLDQHQDEKPEMKEDSKLVLTTSIIKKQEESKRKLKEQDKDKKLEIKEESNEEEVILIEKQEESKLKVVDQYKDEKLEMKEDSKVETEKSIEKQEESTLNVEDQSKDQKLEIKEDSKVETEKSIEKQEECTLNVEDQTKDEKLEIKEDSKVETEKTIDKLEENKLKLEDQHKDEVIGMEDDSKKGISKSIEKQEESKLKVVDQYKDEKLEMKEDGKVETEKTIEKQEESTLNVEDQIKNEKLEIKDDSKVETEKSIEKQEESTLNVEDQSKDNKLEIKEDGKIETEKSIEKQEESTLNVEVQSKNEKLEMKEDAKVISTTSIIEIQKQSKPNLKVQDKDEKLKIKEQSNEVKVKLVEKQEESKDEKLEMKEDVKVISTTPIENQEEKTLILLDDEPKDELKMKNDNRIETTNSLEKQEECELKLKDQLINGVLEMKDGSKIEITEAIEKQEEIKLKLEEQYKDQKIETKNDSKVETRNTLEKQEESMLTSEDQHKDEVLEMKDDSSVKITETIQKQEESKLTLEDQYKDETAKSIEKQQESSLKLKDQYKDEKLDDTNDDIKVETPKSIEKQEESKLKLEYQRKDEKLEMKDGNIEIVLSIEKQEESQLKLEDEHKTEVLKKQKENKLKSEDLNEDKKLERKEDSKVKLTQSVEKQEEKKLNSDDQDKSEQLEIQEDSQGKIAESIQKQEDSNLKSENQNINEKFETKDVCIIDTSKSIEKQGEIKLKLEDKQRDEKLEIKEDSKGEISKSIKKQEDSNVKSENQNKDEKLETKDDSKIETKSIEVQEKSKLKLEDQHKDENLETKDGKEEIAESITKPEKSKLRLEDKLEDETPDKSIDKLAESELKLEVKKVGKMIEVKEDSVIESDQQKLAQLKDKINKEEESSIIQEKPSELKKSVKQEKESKLKLEDDHKNENLETSLGVKDKNGIKGIGTILEIHKKDSQLEKSIVKEEEESHNNNVETLHEKQIAEKRQSKKSRQRQLGINDEKTNCENNGQLQKFIGEITEKEQVNETAKLENQSKDLAESNTETPKEINKDKKMINKKEIATKQESEKIKEIKSTDVEESILMDEKRILSEKAINQETNLSKDITTYQKDSMISENQNTKKLDVTTEKQIIREKGTLCEEKYSKLSVNEGKIKGTPNAENIMSEINEEEVGSKQKMQSKVSPEFIGCTKPDYNLEFTKPPTYISKTYDVEDTVSQIKTNNKIPTMYKAQTLLYESQLRSSLPPYQRSSEGRTELKDITKAVSESRNTLSEKRTGIARDSRRKPVFSTYLTDRTAVESSRVKLTCSILSVSDPTITWYKNGSVLDNKQKFRSKFVDGLITLEVLNAIPSDSGEYSCSVQNENGSVTSSANLKVYPSFEASPIPPTFTRSIRDTYHLADNELVLECRIRGQPLPAITWLKNNEAIILNERIQSHYLADGVCRLTIISPTSGDSGKYTCKAENSVWSDEISHDVYFAGIESRVCPRFGAIEKIHLNRQAIESRRPHFTNVLTDHQVVSGGTIGLQVEIRGDPTRVEWLREGRSVTELYRHAQTYVDHDIYTLALTDVTEKESGLYTCRAWSSHGNVDMNASITVVQVNLIEGKPATIVSRPAKDLLISVGEDINISFRVRGEPKPKVFILKGIRDITNSLRVCKMTSDDYVKFTLKRSVIGDAGTYCIFARNAYGCDRAFVTVVVRQRASSDTLISDWTYPMDDLAILAENRNYKSVPDRILSEPSVVDGGNNWISLAWSKPDTQAKAPILAYKIECWMLGKEGGARWTELGITPRNSFDAFNLKQGEEYHFRVTPRNRYGWGESVQTSAPIGIGLAGDRPEFTDILTGQLKVLLGESAVLGCSFKGNPRPEIVWMKNGHEIEEEKDRVTIDIDNLNTSLHINEVKIEDEGRYSCEATNIHGRSSTYARMAVITDRHIWEADAKLKRERSAGIDGEYPPQFTMRLRDRRVQATYPVRLTCQVVGNPSPVLTWFKNGKEIPSDGRHITSQDECFHTLEIAPTTLEDGGVYEAMARNCYGAISCRCSLVVDKGIRAYIAPEFCCGLEPLYHLSEGDELRISAVVEAYPSVGVTWYRDGVRLRPSRRAIMTLDRDGQIELALASVTGRDAGVYTCTASNEVGRASTSGKVEVVSESNIVEKTNVPPIVISPDAPYSKEPLFIRKPRSSEAHEGDTVIIECEVIGDPKPDVYWLRDFLKPDYYRDARHFRRVGAGPAYRFEIPHAKFDYTGAYSIIAKNIHGEAKAIISLQILAKDPSAADDAHNIRFGRVEVIPHIDKELTDLLCYDGDAIEFDCRVSGNPEPDIRWFHYNEIVSDCPDFESSYELGIARLKIKQVTAEDEGTYSCEASNSLGKATSSACLVVYPPGEPNTLSQQLRRPPALLSAASTPHSTPRTTPARSKSRTPGPDLRRLRSPTREVAPNFYTYPYNKVAEEGDTIVFQCAVKGLPPPWATWDKDGIIITPSARFNIKEKDETFKILEIEQVTIEDVGLYRITLENDYGRTEASARLEVITQKGKFYGTTRSYSASPRKSLSYRRRTPSFSKQE